MEEEMIRNKSGQANRTNVENSAKNQPTKLSTQIPWLHNIFDDIPEAILFTDQKGHIQYMNNLAISMLGIPEEHLEPEEWPQKFGLYLDDSMVQYPGHKIPLMRALKGEIIPEEEMILRKDREETGKWISMSATPIKGENKSIEGARVFLRDVTNKKQIEASREKQARRIETLYELTKAITEAGNNLNHITHAATKLVAEVVGDLSTISLLDASHEKLIVTAYYDTNPNGQALLSKLLDPNDTVVAGDQSLSSNTIKSGESLLIPSIPVDQLQAVPIPVFREYIDEVGIESILIVPLMGRSGALGTISLSRHRGRKAYTIEDKSFLEDIAYRIALAIENCRLFDSLREEISEKLHVEEALKISEERFRSIFEATAIGIKVLDLNGTILQINPSFQKMLGYKETEIIGRHFYDFLHPEDSVKVARLYQDSKYSNYFFRSEHRLIDCENSVLWVKSIYTVVKKGDESNEPAFIVAMLENITEQKRMELEVAELNSRLQGSMELERLRLAQELHDNPMQSLYTAIYRIEELRKMADVPMDVELEEVTKDIQKVLQDLRYTAKELRPPSIFNFGLENAIRSYVDDILEKHPGLQIRISLAHDRQLLPEKVRLALFRVLQQALMNVVRHAEATEVDVQFSFDVEQAYLVISDNGKGFEVPHNWIEFVRKGHYGLAGAAERVNALGGVLKVESQPGNSTTIHASIPWTEATED